MDPKQALKIIESIIEQAIANGNFKKIPDVLAAVKAIEILKKAISEGQKDEQ